MRGGMRADSDYLDRPNDKRVEVDGRSISAQILEAPPSEDEKVSPPEEEKNPFTNQQYQRLLVACDEAARGNVQDIIQLWDGQINRN